MFVIATPSPNDRSLWSFQRLISVTESIKCSSRNFDIGGPRSGQVRDLCIISHCEKIERRLFWTKTILNALKYRVTGIIDVLNRNIALGTLFHGAKVSSGHERSPVVFSAIAFDRDKIEQWKHRWCVQADGTYRLICNMTYSDQIMTLTWGQISNITF